jgi:hypothetical protein
MRCPKCGFISFDHVEACLRCNKDITKATSQLEGTTYNVTPPSFLKFQKSENRPKRKRSEISFDESDDHYDVIDPDLNVLVEDEDEDAGEAGISFGDDFEGFGNFGEEESSKPDHGDDDSDDVGIDLGQFEDAFEEEEPAATDDALVMDLPDELADLSDLSAPSEAMKKQQKSTPADADDFGDFSLDLDLDELDEGDFSLTSSEDKGHPEEDSLGNLSLDDLGLVPEEKPKPRKKKEHGNMDMDADLDFDLDLGGISLDKDE